MDGDPAEIDFLRHSSVFRLLFDDGEAVLHFLLVPQYVVNGSLDDLLTGVDTLPSIVPFF